MNGEYRRIGDGYLHSPIETGRPDHLPTTNKGAPDNHVRLEPTWRMIVHVGRNLR